MRNKILSITLFIQIICFIAVLGSFTQGEIVQARDSFQEATPTPQPFLGVIYYGRKTVTNVFDHRFPGDRDNNNYVIHYDGTQHDPATNTPTAPEISPTPGEWIRNGYGYSGHLGIDYNLIYRPVLAAATGIVEVANWSVPDNHRLGYGLHVVMSHPDNSPGPDYQTWYGHLSSLTVQIGDEINFGEWNDPADRRRILGISGNTGRVIGLNDGGCPNVEDEHSCGYHLHFEVRLNGVVVNPYGWIAVGVDGTPIPDPWAEPEGSEVISYDLWSTRPAIATRPATSSSQYPDGFILAEPDPPIPYITVDNADEEHYRQTPNDCMTPESGGHNDTFHRAQVINDENGTPTCTVRWTITPPNGTTPNDDGYYELYAYIPETTLTLSRGAVYKIFHIPEGGSQLEEQQAIAVQAVFPNEDHEGDSNWVYLGRYHFVLDGTETIELSNATFDGDNDTFYVAADAIQLSAAVLPPTNTPTPVATNTPTASATSPPSATPTVPPTLANTPTPAGTPSSGSYMTRLTAGTYYGNRGTSAISNNGSYVAFHYGISGDIWRWEANTAEEVADFGSHGDAIDISDDGRYIAFAAPGPYFYDVFLYDRNTGTSQNLTNHPQNSSIDHIYLFYIKLKVTSASVLVGYTAETYFYGNTVQQKTWLYDSAQGTSVEIDLDIGSTQPELHGISNDGNLLLLQDVNSLYVSNRNGELLDTINPPPEINSNRVGAAAFSADGNFVVYMARQQVCSPTCSNIGHIFWYDRANEVSDEITMHQLFGSDNAWVSESLGVSDDGRYVFYMAHGHIYRYDRQEDEFQIVTITTDGVYPTGAFDNLDISGDGRFVTFTTYASNLVSGDTPNTGDVFLADMDQWLGTPLVTPTPNGSPTPTPTPGSSIICIFPILLAANEAQDVVVADHVTPAATRIIKPVRQFVGKMIQAADMLTLLYRLRDEVMSQTETGLFYTDLYYTHSTELTNLVQADPNLFQETRETTLLFQPHLDDLLNSSGDNVVITAVEVQAVQQLLDNFTAVASPQLQQTIAAESNKWPLEDFIGKTPNEVWDSLNSNLLLNGDFEEGLTDWIDSDSGDVTLTTDAYTGANALLFGSDSRAGQNIYDIIPGETYTLEGWGWKTGSQWSGIGLTYYDAGHNQLSTENVSITSAAYTPFTLSLIAPANSVRLRVYIRNNPGVGTFTLDSLSLAAGPPPPLEPPQIHNGDFEQGLMFWSAEVLADITITSDAHTGSNALRLGSDSTSGQNITGIVPGEIYTVDGWGHSSGSQWSSIGMIFYDADNNVLSSQNVPANSATYMSFTLSMTAPANSERPRLYIRNNPGSGTMTVDTLTLTIGLPPTPTPTQTAMPAPTATNTPTAVATNTPANTNTPIPTNTNTPPPTATVTPVTTPALPTTIPPEADAFVHNNQPSQNFGSLPIMYAQNGTNTRESYLRFNVPSQIGTITKATLRLYLMDTTTTGFDLYHVSNNTWSEQTITYNNAPGMDTFITSSGATSANSWVELDVTSVVNAEGQISFGLSSSVATLLRLRPREHANAPELLIETNSSATPAPTSTPITTATATATLLPSQTPTTAPSATSSATPTLTATPVLSATPSNTPLPATNTPAPTNTPEPGGADIIYVSSSSAGTVAGISFGEADILAYDTGSSNWSLHFDASDVGLTSDVDAFHLLDDGSILLSVSTDGSIPDAGNVDDSDIIRFVPTSLGETTAGTFELYFDGSDVGLSLTPEDIDAVSVLSDGRLLISTIGGNDVLGLHTDGDILLFNPTMLGENTTGTWEEYLVGTDVELATNNEDIWGIWVDEASGDIYLSTMGAFSVTGASGDGSDIFICAPASVAPITSCTYSFFWDGSAEGFAGEVIDGLFVARP